MGSAERTLALIALGQLPLEIRSVPAQRFDIFIESYTRMTIGCHWDVLLVCDQRNPEGVI